MVFLLVPRVVRFFLDGDGEGGGGLILSLFIATSLASLPTVIINDSINTYLFKHQKQGRQQYHHLHWALGEGETVGVGGIGGTGA